MLKELSLPWAPEGPESRSSGGAVQQRLTTRATQPAPQEGFGSDIERTNTGLQPVRGSQHVIDSAQPILVTTRSHTRRTACTQPKQRLSVIGIHHKLSSAGL